MSRSRELTFLILIFHLLTQGNSTTNNLCSKCFRELQAREGKQKQTKSNSGQAVPASIPIDPSPTKPVSEVRNTANPTEATVEPQPKVMKKKKKKKASYKSMMASMTQGHKEHDIEKEKESLRKVTGGGAFSKIDKI